ncbi:Uncharacterized protein HZ326_10257 [Fusarium oxysporum f. sp. albedinis]|nr:Uncharacterized protein HZ326_10257 [Fusarium oxysporum f. sp. albedinis]
MTKSSKFQRRAVEGIRSSGPTAVAADGGQLDQYRRTLTIGKAILGFNLHILETSPTDYPKNIKFVAYELPLRPMSG